MLALRVFLACLAAQGCGAAPSAPARPATPPPDSTPVLPDTPERPRDEEWGAVRLADVALELTLPEANAWQLVGEGAWLRLVHEPSDSELELRLVRAERLAQPAACAARFRLERPDLPANSEETRVDARRVASPRGFVTELSVNVEAASTEPAVVGHVLGFGAAIGKCLGFHFVTRGRGAGAEAEVARRLGLFVERVVPTLRALGIEDRVEPAPAR